MSEQTDHGLVDSDFRRLSMLPIDVRTIKNVLHVAALCAKSKGRESGSNARLDITDIEAALQYTVGRSDNSELQGKMDEFYKEAEARNEKRQ
jgi:hypothetical protein